MKKNSFMIYNDLVYELYGCKAMEDIMRVLHTHMKMLIPFSYASILLAGGRDPAGKPLYEKPLCIPETFTEAETKYIEHIDEDPQAWLMYGSETTLIRESDLMEDENRLTTPLYQHCYSGYGIYDSMQASLIYRGEFLGILTLFRVRKDGLFTEDDAFFCRAMCAHLDRLVWTIRGGQRNRSVSPEISRCIARCREAYHLTSRECEILSLIFQMRSNDEIADQLGIRESTLQKHLQNLYRKTGSGSRLELVRLMSSF